MTALQIPHTFPIRVYFEDTDAGGIVYYANYLKYIERARTEMLRAIGASHANMMKDTNTQFVVRRCSIDYHKPARLDEELIIRSRVTEIGAASLTLQQEVWRDKTLLTGAEIGLACVNENGEPCRIPAVIRATIDAFLNQKIK